MVRTFFEENSDFIKYLTLLGDIIIDASDGCYKGESYLKATVLIKIYYAYHTFYTEHFSLFYRIYINYEFYQTSKMTTV